MNITKLFILFLFFSECFQMIYQEQDIEINFPTETNKYFENITSIIYMTINIENYSEISEEYFHIMTNSSEKNISPLIISSKNNSHPYINNSDIYSTQKLGNANLILPKEFLNNKIFLSIECSIYPCSFYINFSLEVFALLNSNQIFSYFIKENIEMNMKFKISSQLNMDNGLSHIYDIGISFSNELLVETDLYFNNTKINKKIIEKGNIYSFLEENIIKDYNESQDNYYILEIKSKEEQYISISISSKIFDNNYNIYTKEIIPNEGELYSYLNKDTIKQECYKINQDLIDNNNSLIYASIIFYSEPINYYFINNNKEKSKIYTPLQNSINIIFPKEDDIFQTLCFNIEKENDEGIYKIDISDTKDNLNKMNINSPLMTGIIYKKILSINDITYFTFNPFLRNFTQMNFNLKVIKGNVKMLLFSCNFFPYCKYTYEELIQNIRTIKPHIINNMYSYSEYFNQDDKCLSPFGHEQNLMYVYCSNETMDELCQFEISFFSDKDKILLLNNDKFYQYMLKDEIDLYKINIPNYDNIYKIRIILYTFTGETKYEILNNDSNKYNIQHDFIGGMDIYEYNILNNNSINNIEFNINAIINSYYEIEYKIIKNLNTTSIDIENLIYFDEKYSLISSDITYKDLIKYSYNNNDTEKNKKYYIFKNSKKLEKKSYFVQIFSLNCELEIKRDEKIISESGNVYQDIINYNEEYYNNEYYIYETKINKAENYGEQEYENCVIYISGEPINNDNSIEKIYYSNKILLTENDPHDIILTKEIKFYNYLYPYLGNSSDINAFNLIHIKFDSKMSIKVKILFDEDINIKKEVLMGRSDQILLDKNLIQENCIDNEEICNIIIQVEFINENYDKSWTSPNFQLLISTQNKIPSYLKNGELRLDSVVNSNPLQYFYTDISKNSQGQIISYTKKGEGVLYIRIYKKGTKDQNNNWRDIHIPDKDSTDILFYDSFTHSSNFNSEQTKNCGNDGCLLLITYENIYSKINDKNYLTPFTIMTRLYTEDKNNQSILDIPLNVYTYGVLSQESLSHNYYRIYFPENSDRIDFEIQCETCVLYISKNTSLLPNENSYDYKYNSQGKFGVYSLYINEQIKSKYFLLNIESPFIKDIITTYSFRVSLPIESDFTNYNIIQIDSEQNAICDMNLKINDGICYFMLYLDESEFISNEILAHIYTDIDLLDLKMKANFIPKKIAESNDINKIVDYLPNEMSKADYSTENQFYQDYLIININERKNKDDYIIYSVSSEYTATVTFLATYFKYGEKVLSNTNGVQLMKLNKNQEINLFLSSNHFFLNYFYSLYGKGEIQWKDNLNNTRKHILNEHEMFTYINIDNNEPNLIRVNNKSNLAFYFWRDVIDISFYIKEIDFNMKEKFLLYNISSSKFYCLLPLTRDDDKNLIFEDLIFNIQLNFDGINNSLNINNSIIIYGTIITLEMINEIKIKKDDEKIINILDNMEITKLDKATNSANLLLNNSFCKKIWDSYTNIDKTPNAYLYISIKSDNKNTVDNNILSEALITFRNNINYIVPNNQIIQAKLDFNINNKNENFSYYLYNLQLDGNYEKNKIILDISTNILIAENNLLYSIIDYDNDGDNKINYNKNSSNILIDEKNSKYMGGKYHIEFTLNQISSKANKGVYLCFFSYNKITVNTLFKYNTYFPSDKLPIYNMDNNIKIKYKENNLEININTIEKIFNEIISYPNSEFIIRKIEKNKKIKNEDISTISIINTEYEILYRINNVQNIKNIEIKFPFELKENEKFYVSIIAYLFNDKEKFAYNLIDSDNIEKNEDNNKDNNLVIISLIIVIIIILIISGVFIYLYIKKKRFGKDYNLKNKIQFNDGKLLNEDENIIESNIN